MHTDNLQIITYMVPVNFDDGKGFRSHVSPEPGCWLVISEVHRVSKYSTIDETLVFPADETGGITSLNEMFSAGSTPDALQRIKDGWDVEAYHRRRHEL
jgi:hypothetical protein